MAKIYITVENGEKFIGSDGKEYDKLWTIERKVTGNMQLCGATINGELRAIDFTVPTVVKKLPRGAVSVPNEEAEKLYKSDSWYFGR